MLYIAQGYNIIALFIYEIMSAKRTREVRPAVFVRESSTQLVMY